MTVPAALPAPAVVAPRAAAAGLPLAPSLPGLALTGAFAPSALAGGSLPAGFSAGLFGAGFGNPALLAGTPFGAATAGLYQPQTGPDVTTVSHSEALAPSVQRGVGTPTAIAAIVLALLVAVLVRQQVLRRIARRDLMLGSGPGEPDAADAFPAGSVTSDSETADDRATDDRPLLAA